MRASGEGLLTSLTDKCLLVGGDWEEGEENSVLEKSDLNVILQV